MRVKVSACATMFWDDGKLVWDDWLAHQQLALTEHSERVLRWFGKWRELDSVRQLDERLLPIAHRLVDTGVLVVEGSEADQAQQRLMSRWREWGAAAHFHFASRALADAQYWLGDDDLRQMQEKGRRDPPPPTFARDSKRPLTPLPAPPSRGTGWPCPDLVAALYRRRSDRQFSESAVSLTELGTVVQVTGGVTDLWEDPLVGAAVFKTSPSAGALAPIELYVHTRRVEGIVPGIYHYAPGRSGLEHLREPCHSDELVQALGGQEWAAHAAALIIFTAVVARHQWRYSIQRGYRDLLLDVGHLSQTALLVATGLGLGATFITAVRDERLERLLGCDPAEEIVLGATALGRPAS